MNCKNTLGLLLLAFLFALTSCAGKKEQQGLKLWYKQPADEWMKATPAGNGRLGAMIYGGIETETIALNEITMWSGQYDENQEDSCGKQKLAEMRKLFFEGKIIEGNELAAKYLSGKPHSFGTHLPVGNLKIDFKCDTSKISNYRRELDIQNSLTTVTYKIDNINYKREYICSNPDDVLLIKLSSDSKKALNFDMHLDLLRESEITISGKEITFSGQALFPKQGPGGVHYIGKISVSTNNGGILPENNVLSVKNADEAIIAIDIRTDYKNPDYQKQCSLTISNVFSKKYEDVKQAHVQDYRKLFDRVELFLGKSDADQLPTDVRWKKLREGNFDPGLEALFFQYGRYLLISSSRENSPLPANLQGVWNDNLACNMPWTCDYHLDINTEQNYWAANVTNLHECNIPLFEYIKDLSVHGEKTAMKVYGSPGWTAHTVANVWGYTAPGQGVTWGLFPTAGVWMSTHLWEHYLFTKDVDFLKNQAYPILKKAAIFIQDYMVENPNNGYLMTGPGNSPENSFLFEGRDLALSMMPTGDRILIYELYSSCIESAKILEIDSEFRQSLERDIQKLPPLKIGRNGEIQEWFEDYQNAHPNHRHAMHILSLYPYNQVSPEKTPELAKAAELVIDNKLKSENWEDVEFCRAMMVAFYARLKQPEKAYSSLNILMNKLMRENLFTISLAGIAMAEEDIFIFDGNEAAPAAMAEMLIQSHNGYIEFLPALPTQWKTGFFKGLCVKGGAEADLEWKDNVMKKAKITSTFNNTFTFKLKDAKVNFQLNGATYQPVKDNNGLVTVDMKKGDYLEIIAL